MMCSLGEVKRPNGNCQTLTALMRSQMASQVFNLDETRNAEGFSRRVAVDLRGVLRGAEAGGSVAI